MQGLEMTLLDGLRVVDDGLADQTTLSDDCLSVLSCRGSPIWLSRGKLEQALGSGRGPAAAFCYLTIYQPQRRTL